MSRDTMSRDVKLDRRLFVTGAAGLALAGCDRIASSSRGQDAFSLANDMSYVAQRALMGARELAPEFSAGDISTDFRANGSIDPKEPDYKALAQAKFETWSMPVSGLVEKPRAFTLADLRAMPARTQITRHDCVEGWSCIGQWSGPPLPSVLDLVVPKPEARYVVFYCYDALGPDQSEGNTDGQDEGNTLSGPPPKFYGTIDMADATHPQTILAHSMNGAPLPIAHGAPLRLRVERQLGYKMNKYIKSIELVANFQNIGGGKGGYWEDLGYDWYAGI
jgi:DMSO/TMAO reductase YedYZ molybdopterin-dependent catalytic subunit